MINITNKIPDPIREEVEFLGDNLIVELNHFAYKADAAITVQKGETVVLATVTGGQEEIGANFLPLSVEYIEKYYAGGLISSSRFVKREMRPSDDATLKARQIDHAIRSLFPKYWRKPISVTITVLAYDQVNDPEQIAVFAASTALMLSSIPFGGPSVSITVGLDSKENLIWGPKMEDHHDLQMEMVYAVLGDRVLNIEGWANEVDEKVIIDVMDEAVAKAQPILEFQTKLAEKYGAEKQAYENKPAPTEVISRVEKDYNDGILFALQNKDVRQNKMNEMKAELAEKMNAELEANGTKEEIEAGVDTGAIEEAFEYVARKILRKLVLEKKERTSGRALDQIRPLRSEVGVLPRVHGSATFTRGMTQALTVLTIGSTSLAQTKESFQGESEKRFMHHYNSPNYSYGDAGRFSYYPGRREIGHGNIGENGLKPMIPSAEDFPYTIRLSSEIMSSNGSTSMAATCASTLALMDGGVPIKAPVAGVALGLVTDDNDLDTYEILTDMEDVEDFYGDMDFKVTGTKKGVTAIQLDNKLKGVPAKILTEAFEKSKQARSKILDQMAEVIAEPRKEVGEYAPKVEVFKIDPENIGLVIGPGGKNIKEIMELTDNEVDIDIQDDGNIFLASTSKPMREKVIELIKKSTGDFELNDGEIYPGKVDKVMDYGIFVDLGGNISGLVHVSELSTEFVKDVNSMFKVGDEVDVMYVGKDDQGRIKLSIKAIADKNKSSNNEGGMKDAEEKKSSGGFRQINR